MSKVSIKSKLKPLKKWSSRHRNFLVISTNTLAFVALGIMLLIFTKAATPVSSIESEQGVLGGSATMMNDNSASNRMAIRFNGSIPTTPSSIMLPNNLEINKYKMNERANDSAQNQIVGKNIKLGSYSSTGGNGLQGQFRMYCKYSHFNYDDPIVYPGQPGKAHLHMYWGNTMADAYSTKQTLTTKGGGTCEGFELNRTAYWMPALLDGTGNVVIPKAIVMYYKSGGRAGDAAKTTRMPQGLKMISGNSSGNTTQTGYHNQIEWNCYDGSASWLYPADAYGQTSGTTIPASCPNGYDLNSLVYFQQCWNGTGLERTDVQLDNNGQCPAGWKTMPQVSYHIFWPKSPTGSYANWYLSSDRMPGMEPKKNGSTLHADWFGGWNDAIMDEWIAKCIQTMNNCGNGQLGDGNRSLMTFYPTDYEGPTNFLPKP